MAMFRHHISIGAIIATVAVTLALFYSVMTDPLFLGILFAICAFGSVLPDFDSDSGLPFYLTFGAATLAFAGAVLYFTLSGNPQNPYILVGIPLLALIGFWFIVGGIVKHCTHHRGIWHSMPMLFVASMVTYLGTIFFTMPQSVAIIFAVGMAAGFLSHLVLDELWSTVDHDGNPFTYKRSLGTAMKFFSESRKVNIVTYALLAGLVYLSFHPAVI